MSLRLRIAILQVCLSMTRVRRRINTPRVYVLRKLVDLSQARKNDKFKKYEKAAHDFGLRANSILPELQNLSQLTEDRRRQVLAARSSLLKESNNLKTTAQNLTSGPTRGDAALMYVLLRTKSRAERLQRRNQAFSRIVTGIMSDNFYWDLLLWFVGGSEEMLGDLNEEYVLRISNLGKASARAWYYDQTITSVRAYLWKKVERIAAVGTLIDLISRWFKS